MRSYILTFVSDDIDKMRVFGALLDAGLKEFVITEQLVEPTVAENAQVDHFREATKKIELMEE